MDPFALTAAVTALANAIACRLNPEQLNCHLKQQKRSEAPT